MAELKTKVKDADERAKEAAAAVEPFLLHMPQPPEVAHSINQCAFTARKLMYN